MTYGDFEYEWFGRELRGYTDTYSGVSAEFVYGYDGLRTKKLVSDGTYVNEYDYLWSPYDGKLVSYNITFGETNESVTVMILRDENDEPFGITLNEQAFYYVKNLQGDVVRVVDGDGVTVLDYFYDAWGNITFEFGADANLGLLLYLYNPITYRGYYFDAESGMYYLESRYYNPEWGRVINGDVDSYISNQNLESFNPETPEINPEVHSIDIEIVEVNLFSYGNNNPIAYVAANESGDKLNTKEKLFLLYYTGKADTIVRHWIIGKGKKLTFDNNSSWNTKMFSNKHIKKALDDAVKKALDSGKASFSYTNTAIMLSPPKGGYGNDVFELLNGANQDVGGFDYKGTIVSAGSGKYTVAGEFTFNDIIDYNLEDIMVYRLVRDLVLSKGHGTAYILKIRCTYSYTYKT